MVFLASNPLNLGRNVVGANNLAVAASTFVLDLTAIARQLGLPRLQTFARRTLQGHFVTKWPYAFVRPSKLGRPLRFENNDVRVCPQNLLLVDHRFYAGLRQDEDIVGEIHDKGGGEGELEVGLGEGYNIEE